MMNWFFVGGVIAHTQFVAGNIALAAVAIPALRSKGLATQDLLKAWSGLYHNGKNFFSSVAVVATLCYTVAAVQNPAAKVPILISAAFAISPLPWTIGVMLPNVNALLLLEEQGVEELAKERLTVLERFDKWTRQNIVRFTLSGIGLANSLYLVLYHCRTLRY
ncbi:hypothetical protein TRVA0_067S00144 [Trichomonascus vanleenenianus]|uniref:DUF1772 domain-containing protein n=1 Tax=Trichomonascus vanleenenianus TaxID=2268995 RepID=UPI003ECA8385